MIRPMRRTTPCTSRVRAGAACAAALLASVLVSLVAVPSPVAAQGTRAEPAWPTRPVRIVVAYPPGAAVEVIARAAAQKMQESLGQPFVVENRPGANGLVGAESVARSTPDGHTVLVIDRGALTINPHLYKTVPYDPVRDFAYTGAMVELRYVLAIHPGLPAANFAEFVQMVKAKPGTYNYASFGVGSIIQLNFERLNAAFGLRLVHVPYKGTSQAVAAVVSGESQIMMSSAQGVQNFVRDGRLRAIAVGAPRRLPQMPDVPTIAEVGGDDDTLVPTYFTFAAPGGTAPATMTRLAAELRRVLTLPDVEERLQRAGLQAQFATPEAFTEGVRRDHERFGALVRQLDVPKQ